MPVQRTTKDYYKLLGVSRKAPLEQIKKAYYRLAKQYHPDRNPGDKAAEARFKDINEAYEVLGDGEKRAQYDNCKIVKYCSLIEVLSYCGLVLALYGTIGFWNVLLLILGPIVWFLAMNQATWGAWRPKV